MIVSTREVLAEAGERAARGEAFVLATIVGRRAPSSARPAQKALVLPDGTLRGFLGGSCIEPVVRREALAALGEGRPRRVLLAPEAPGARGASAPVAPESSAPATGGSHLEPDVHPHPMTCHSGGTVEIFLEPYLPAPVLELYGDSPVVAALEAMAPTLGWTVARRAGPGPDVGSAGGPGAGSGAAPGADASAAAGAAGSAGVRAAVVATMGVWDETAAERALEGGAAWVGLVASPRRTAEVRGHLAERGVAPGRLERLRGPAGLDLGAETPAEIAVSILAELVERRLASAPPGGSAGAAGGAAEGAAGSTDEAGGAAAEGAAAGGAPAGTAVDPVCGMDVDTAASAITLAWEGTVYHFCCEGCRERFRADPAAFGA